MGNRNAVDLLTIRRLNNGKVQPGRLAMLASPFAWWNAGPHFGTVNLPYSKNKSFALSFHRLRRLVASLC
jgi:hypothetical protein